MQRNPRVAALTAVALALVLLVTIGSSYTLVRLANDRQKAAETDALSAINQAFETGLEARDWTDEQLSEMEGLVQNLRRWLRPRPIRPLGVSISAMANSSAAGQGCRD